MFIALEFVSHFFRHTAHHVMILVPISSQPEASLVVESAHGEESVVSERLLTRGAHLARPTVTNHLAVCVVFPLHLFK